jgi:hypothetical protein
MNIRWNRASHLGKLDRINRKERTMRKAYLFYEAGQAVAAAHLGLKIRHVSGNPAAEAPTHIVMPRDAYKARMILWLTGMAAEKKGVGRSDPLRRTRNRQRVRAQIEAAAEALKGSRAKRHRDARMLLNQAQDRANAICSDLYAAIETIANQLSTHDRVEGDEVVRVVQAVKAQRSIAGQSTVAEEHVEIVPNPPAPPSPSRKPREFPAV